MGRSKLWDENMLARFPVGTFERIATLLKTSETKMDFVRLAVEREINRRIRAEARKNKA